MRLVLDSRQHPTGSLGYHGADKYQGAALLASNDAMFTEADFASISRVGDSGKREVVDKTGRFGCGSFSLENAPT